MGILVPINNTAKPLVAPYIVRNGIAKSLVACYVVNGGKTSNNVINALKNYVLYETGKENEKVVGEWVFPTITTTRDWLDSISGSLSKGNITRTKEQEYINLEAFAQVTYQARVSVYTSKKIDLTAYKAIHVEYDVAKYRGGALRLAIFNDLPDGISVNRAVNYSNNVLTQVEDDKEIILDISNVTSAYISISMSVTNKSTDANTATHIKKIWLE